MDNREKLLKQIQELDFAVYELNLYLDTHPDDKKMLGYFKEFVVKSKELKHEYNEKYGPLMAADNTADTWEWISNPWPWDK